MATTRDFRSGFFSDKSTVDAIRTISAAQRLTLFVGAGVSADQNVPTWAKLVQLLLRMRLSPRNGTSICPDQQVAEALSRRIVDSAFQLPAASMVDDLYAAEFGSNFARRRNQDIRRLVYGAGASQRYFLDRPSLSREALLMAIYLKGMRPSKDIHIITTNYDDSLAELATQDDEVRETLQQFRVKIQPHATRLPEHLGSSTIPVLHIHGRIPRKGRSESVVFSESDYVRWTNTGQLRDYLYDRFSHGASLMLGTSLRDYNINDHLARSAPGGDRIALLPLQGDDLYLADPDIPIDASEAATIARIQDGRGSQLGVRLLHPDFFGQVLQFVHEVRLLATKTPGAPGPGTYLQRVALWWSDFTKSANHDETARRKQTKLLQATSTKIVQMLDGVDHAKVELWIRSNFTKRSDPRTMQQWCSSQSLWIDNGKHWPHSVQIGPNVADPAVVSFAARSTVTGPVPGTSSRRWTHFCAVPIILQDDPYLSIPVGAVVLSLHSKVFAHEKEIPSLEAKLPVITEELARVGGRLVLPVAPRPARTAPAKV